MDAHDPRALIEAAEQEAGAGNYSSAEHLLREAASLQETQLGPLHPDLANTLNNLAIVCEMANKPADAERCYRRAYSIAVTTLEPHHPFVATSRQNLVDFWHARGMHGELPKPEPTTTASDEHASMQRPLDDRSWPSASRPPEPSFGKSSRAIALGAVAVGVVLFALFLSLRPRVSTQEQTQSATEHRVGSPSENATPAAAPPAAAEPIPAPDDRAANSKDADGTIESSEGAVASDRMPAPAETPARADTPVPAPASPATTADTTQAAASLPNAGTAQLCTNLSTSTWSCDRAVSPLTPGPVVFYTRVTSETDTMVEHRWYRGEKLEQAVALRIRANSGPGYRTYSRRTVDRGDWRVELRSQDGSVLHEERFVVQ